MRCGCGWKRPRGRANGSWRWRRLGRWMRAPASDGSTLVVLMLRGVRRASASMRVRRRAGFCLRRGGWGGGGGVVPGGGGGGGWGLAIHHFAVVGGWGALLVPGFPRGGWGVCGGGGRGG